jgi:hypothetical protein
VDNRNQRAKKRKAALLREEAAFQPEVTTSYGGGLVLPASFEDFIT